MYVREIERERVCVCVSERESVCVCQRERLCVWFCAQIMFFPLFILIPAENRIDIYNISLTNF